MRKWRPFENTELKHDFLENSHRRSYLLRRFWEGDFKLAAISRNDLAQTGLYRGVIMNVEKLINSGDQIPVEFRAIPNKRGGGNLEPFSKSLRF